jgi:RND family efflux transporter MFP subunit
MKALGSLVIVALAVAMACAPGARAQPTQQSAASGLATSTVGGIAAGATYLADGQVEAVREATITSQVSGQVILRTVRAGDRVKAGQVLLRIDPQAARQNQAALSAQLAAARAQLTAAERHLERTRQLVEKNFVSPATLDRAEADQRAALESVNALLAQTAGAATQTGWHTLTAPFDAVVTSVSAEQGDTALPGRPLMQLHDPSELRVAVNVPAATAGRIDLQAVPAIEIPDAIGEARNPAPGRIVVVPAADPQSYTQLVRIDLPPRIGGLRPGLFTRVRLKLTGDSSDEAPRLTVPKSAVVVRGDLRGVYVVDDRGVALRQVRVGRTHANEVEVLAGLSRGEKVALDPVAAARATGVIKQ